MESFLIVFCIFGGALLSHVIVHRVLIARGILTFRSVLCYAVGLLIMGILVNSGVFFYPLTSLLLYILLSFIAILFYLTPYLGGETPASMILAALRTRERQTYRELRNLFTRKGLIGKRIDDLLIADYVVRRKGTLKITAKGRHLLGVIRIYQKVFHRPHIG